MLCPECKSRRNKLKNLGQLIQSLTLRHEIAPPLSGLGFDIIHIILYINSLFYSVYIKTKVKGIETYMVHISFKVHNLIQPKARRI